MRDLFSKVIGCLLLLVFRQLAAAQPYNYQPESYLVFIDSTASLEIGNVVENRSFHERKELNFGYLKGRTWLKVDLNEPLSKDLSIAMLSHTAIYYADFYVVKNNKVVEVKQTGLKRPFLTRGQWTNKFFMALSPTYHDATLYIGLNNEDASLKTNLVFFSTAEANKEFVIEILVHAALASVVLVLLLYNGVSYYRKPNSIFLFYTGYLLFFFLYLSTNNGMLHLLFPDIFIPFTTFLRVFWSLPALFFLLKFAYKLLDIEHSGFTFFRRLYRFCYVALSAFFLLLILLQFYPEYFKYASAIYYGFYGVVFIILLGSGIFSYRQGHTPSYYFLVGHIPLCAFFVMIALRNFKLLNLLPQMAHWPEFLFVMELITTFICLELFIKNEQHIEALVVGADVLLPDANKLKPLSVQSEVDLEPEIDTEMLLLFHRAEDYMNKEKPYLTSELKIADMAERLGVSSHALSKCINRCSGMHFFDFVNQYRVEHAMQLMSDVDVLKKYTFETIALQCGFNNKTSFNTYFKKVTSLTPSEYKSVQIRKQSHT